MSTIKVDTIATRTGSGNITLSNSIAGTSATLSGDLTVDTNTLHVDAANNRVGIGTTSPGAILQVDRASANFIRFADSGSLTGLIGLDDGATLVSGGTDGDMVIRAETSGKGVVFAGNGATRFGMIDADGLKFNTDTAAANALDDYEEGTWTGTVTTLGTAPSSTQQGDGFYTKIGRQVTVRFVDNTINMSGSSGEMKITGLPFTARNTSGNAGVGSCVLFRMNIGSNVKNISAVVNENSSFVYLYESIDDANYALITDNSTTNGRIWFTITYDI